jgi:hypothetical protein
MTPEDKIFFKLTKQQIDSYNKTGLFPYPTRTGEMDLATGILRIDWEMSDDIRNYIQEQLETE